jgi:Terminase RNaseH-like domain
VSIVLGRAPRSDDELYELVRALWGITIPRHKVCSDHDAPFDAFSEAYFRRRPSILIHGSRGLSGKSRLMSILGLTVASVLGSDVNIVGGSLNQSINIHNTMRNAWESTNAPKYLIKEETATRIKLTNKSIIMPLTASQKSVRGPHPPSLLLDEIDEMELAIFDASLGQPMPQENWKGDIIRPMTVMTSTWQYPDKTFAEVQQRFVDRDEKIYRWCYKDTSNPIDGWLDEETIAQKRLEIPAEMWRVEYDLGEPSIGNRAIDTAAVERMFSLPEEAIKQKVGKEVQEYRFEDPKQDREYVIGADWAQSQDWTVISVVDVSFFPVKVVHWLRMRRHPYPVMIGHFNRLMKEYNAEGIHDATGLGAVVADYVDRRARGFLMTGAQRDNMLSEYISSIENDKWKAPRIPVFYKNHLYCSVEQIYARGKEYHLPDEICSMALAWRLVSKRAVPALPILIPGDHGPTWIEKEMQENRDAKRKPGPWVVGSVQNKSEEVPDEMDLMV